MNPKMTYAVRMTLDQRQELEAMSERTGQDVSALIRAAITALVKLYHASGERLTFPLEIGSPEPPPETGSKTGSHIARSVAAEDPPEVTRPVIPLLSKSVSYRRRKK